jgi:putative acetyltransferase
MIVFKRTDGEDPDFQRLVTKLDLELKQMDGPDHSRFAALNKVDNIREVIVAYDNDEPIGCGALRQYEEDTMEVKRMFVLPARRGHGVASAILKGLEAWCMELGFGYCILETSKKQPEAILLYEKNGYQVIPNYGKYEKVLSSVCFRKRLAGK